MRCLMIASLRNILLGLLAICWSTSLLVAQNTHSEGEPGQPLAQQIYVCNQGQATLSVIDVKSNKVVDKIDLQKLGFSANAKPHHTIAEPDGSHWYVTLIGENRVLKFNRDNKLVGQTEIEVPGLLSLHPRRDLLLVGRSMSAVNPPQSIGLIRRSDMSLIKEVPTFFRRPHAIASSPKNNWVYVASLAENQIFSYNLETDQTNLTTLDGQQTHVFVDFTISPDGNTMVATGQMTGQALIFDLSDPTSPTLEDTVEAGAQPWHPVFSPDGQFVYFGNKEDHTVTAVDMEARRVATIIEGNGIAQPHGSALSADGHYLYISNNNRKGTYQPSHSSSTSDLPGTITVINTKTYEIEKVIEVGTYATGIGTNARH